MNPETEVVPYENCVATPSAIGDGLDTLTPIVVRDSPYTHIAGTVHIHNASLVYKNITESTVLKLQRLKQSHVVETKTAKVGSRQLSESGFILVEGGPLSGKTSIGLQILGRICTKEKHIPIILDRPEDYVQIPPNEKIVVLIDDIFGRSAISSDSVLKWEKVLKDMLQLPRKDNTLLVVTCESAILKEARRCNAPDVLYQPKTTINLDTYKYRIRDYEKYSILSYLVQMQRLKITDAEIVQLSQSLDHPWFYGCCDHLSSHRMDAESFKGFLKNPVQFHAARLQQLVDREPLKFAILVLLMKNGSLPEHLQELDQIQDFSESLQKIQYVLKIQDGIQSCQILALIPSLAEYVSKQGSVYVFRHESVEYAVCMTFGEQSLEELLLLCSDRFLVNYTGLSLHPTNKEHWLVISERHYPILRKRMVQRPAGELFSHPAFSVEGFVEDVFDNMVKSLSKRELLKGLLLSIEYKQRPLVKRLLQLIITDKGDNKEILHEAFEKTCETGDVISFHALRKAGAKPCEICFQKACRLQKNPIVVGCILLELSIDFENLTTICLADCIASLIKVKDQHNLEMMLQQLPNRNDYNSLVHKALKNACSFGSKDDFLRLKDLAMSLDVSTLLNYAIDGENVTIVEWLIDAYCRADSNNSGLGQYFLKACMLKETTVAELLINHDPTVLQAKTENIESSAHKASSVPSGTAPKVLSWLMQKGIDVQCKNAFGQTPLHMACKAGNIQTVSLLLQQGADTSVQDKNGDTPILANLKGSNPSLPLLTILMEHGADLTTKNQQQSTPLHIVCGRKDISSSIMAAWILKRQKCEIDAKDADGNTPLHLLLGAGASDEAIELILDYKASVNIRNNDQQTPLHTAAIKSNAPAVEMLLSKGCDPLTKDVNGQTAFHIAVFLQSEDCAGILLKWLQNKRLSTDTKNDDDRAVIHIAAEAPTNLSFFLHLLEGNIQVSPQDKNGITPLHIVCIRCSEVDEEKLRCLLTKGAIIDAEDEHGITPLHNASMSTGPSKHRMVESLLAYGADAFHQDSTGQSILHKICSGSLESDVQTVELLLATTDANAKDDHGDTPLHKVCASAGVCASQIMQILIYHGSVIEISNKDGDDVIDICLRYSRLRFNLLLELVAMKACEAGSKQTTDTIRKLMTKGGFGYGSDENGCTVVHKLCMTNAENTHAILDYFLTHGVDIHAKTREGRTALHVACMAVGQYTTSILEVLKRRGMDIRARDLQGETALHNVAHVSNRYSVQVAAQLVNMGVDPNTRNVNGDTALQVSLSSEGDSIGYIVKELVSLGSDLRSVNYQGESIADVKDIERLLHSNLLHVYCDTVKLLDINQIRFLLSKGSDISSRDSEGDTVLHKLCSKKGGNVPENISTLLQAGADANALNFNNLTPIDIASFSGQSETTINMIRGGHNPAVAAELPRLPDNGCVSMDTGEQTTQYSTALLPFRDGSGNSNDSGTGGGHPLQNMHDQMDERKELAKDSIASSLLSGNYNCFVDDIVALGTAELFRGGIKTLINRDKKK